MKTLLAALMLTASLAAAAQTSTTTSLAADKQTGQPGTIFTLTATVTDAQGPVRLGQVTFYDGDPSGPASALGTVVLNGANGTATLKRAFIIGSHAVTAKFLGTNTEAASSSSSPTITVTGQYASSITLFNGESGNSESLIARVNGAGPLPITGTITFTDSTTNKILGNIPLNSALLRPGFQQTSTLPPPSALASYAAAATSDFNGDGKLDLAAISNGSTVIQIFIGNGDGTFAQAQSLNIPPSNLLSLGAIATGDINGDGKLDLLVGASNAILYMFPGNGDGTFAAPQTTSVGYDPIAVTLGDFNGDGKLDAATLNLLGANDQVNDSSLSILLGHGDGTFEPQKQTSISIESSSQLVVGDFNRDGKADLVVSNEALYLLLGGGNGTFGPERYVSGGTSLPFTSFFTSGDFNGDGKLDLALLARTSPETVVTFLGHGNGTFEPVLTTSPVSGVYVVTNDFNNDGKLDLVLLDADDNQVAVLLGHGTGAFLAQPPFAVKTPPYTAITGDFSGDGVPGLAINTTNTISTSHLLVFKDFSSLASTAAASLKSSVLTGLSGHTITAAYSGDDNFAKSSTSVVLKTSP